MVRSRVEGCVEYLRRELEVSGFPRWSDYWELAEYHRERLEVEFAPGIDRAWTRWRRRGRTVIWIPEAYDERERALAFLHEFAHWLRALAVPQDERQRLYLLNQDQEERWVQAFMLAWRLPTELLLGYEDDADLLRDSGCSAAEVVDRRRLLIGE